MAAARRTVRGAGYHPTPGATTGERSCTRAVRVHNPRDAPVTHLGTRIAMDLSAAQMALLCAAALCGGTVDAISGGGGLITVPVLLAVGLPPHLALGTNKGQSTFGSFAAIVRYRHAGLIDWKTARISFPLGIVGSVAGAALALTLPREVLSPIVIALLLVVAGLVASGRLRPREGSVPPVGRRAGIIVALLALTLGAYDGFFGPGTGTFIIAGYAALVHMPLPRATAEAKVLNFASNFAAMVMFARHGEVLWAVALPMAAAQLFGGFLGAHLAVRRGDRLIRTMVFVVALAVVVWVLKDVYWKH